MKITGALGARLHTDTDNQVSINNKISHIVSDILQKTTSGNDFVSGPSLKAETIRRHSFEAVRKSVIDLQIAKRKPIDSISKVKGIIASDGSEVPCLLNYLGNHPQGKDAVFRVWAPHAQAVSLKILDHDVCIPMERNDLGVWEVAINKAWKKLQGQPYCYEIVTSDGKKVDRPDPYARRMMDDQRGVSRTFVDYETGREVDQYYMRPDIGQDLINKYGHFGNVPVDEMKTAYENSRLECMRFDVPFEPEAQVVELVFYDEQGRQLTKEDLLARIGKPEVTFGPPSNNYGMGKVQQAYWNADVREDGTIALQERAGAWYTLVNNVQALNGLRYEFQVWCAGDDGILYRCADTNHDGIVDDADVKSSNYNDPWSATISSTSGRSFRFPIVSKPEFTFTCDTVPREHEPAKLSLFQLHVGSFLGKGDNCNASNFKDVINALPYIKKLGINVIELLPTSSFEGSRAWGYLGPQNLAVEDSYGFIDEKNEWISGDEAMKRFVDEAHKNGINVIGDVVYNHIGGNNVQLWNFDGPENPYFNWSKNPGQFEKRDTDWGSMPAYNNAMVKQFFMDHAHAQMEEYHLDGIRFDFTEPVKADWGGGEAGWNLLRDIIKDLKKINPNGIFIAEQFPYDVHMTKPQEEGGAGFTFQWYSEAHHRIIGNSKDEGILQAASRGHKTNMDKVMDMFIHHPGLESWDKTVFIMQNHDEVGHGQRIVVAANADQVPEQPSEWTMGAAKVASGLMFFNAVVPFYFQGSEFMAKNSFQWGIPSTWDMDWSWLDQGDEQNHQKQHYQFYCDAGTLHKDWDVLHPPAHIERLFTNNDAACMGYALHKNNQAAVVLASLNHEDLQNYYVQLPPGNWQLVISSDDRKYGGRGLISRDHIYHGHAHITLPKASIAIFKKID